MAVASLVFGILTMIFCFSSIICMSLAGEILAGLGILCGILGIIFGAIKKEDGFNAAGFVLSIIGLVFSFVLMILCRIL